MPSVSTGEGLKEFFSSQFEPANYAGEIVHSDLAGPIPRSMTVPYISVLLRISSHDTRMLLDWGRKAIP